MHTERKNVFFYPKVALFLMKSPIFAKIKETQVII